MGDREEKPLPRAGKDPVSKIDPRPVDGSEDEFVDDDLLEQISAGGCANHGQFVELDGGHRCHMPVNNTIGFDFS